MPSTLPLLSRAQTSRIRELSRNKHAREADRTFILEGAKAVRDVLTGRPRLVQLVVTSPEYRERESSSDRRLREQAAPQSCSCEERIFASLSGLDCPQGILAVVQQPEWNEEDVLTQPSLMGIFGEQLQDPLNVGAIIRTAAALNASALWLTPDSADRYNPKVVRATGGTILSLPVFLSDSIDVLARRGCAIYAAEVPGPRTVDLEKIERVPRRLIIAVGNEGQGLSVETKKRAACRFAISLSRNVESLNVAATVAIAAYRFSRLPKD